MRILIATDTFLPYHSGIVSSVRRMSSALAADGHEVILIAPVPAGRSHERISLDGVTIVAIPARPVRWMSYRPIPRPLRVIRALDHIMATDKPHVVHIHTPFVIGQLALARARAFRVPVVCTLHLQPDNVSSYSLAARLASRVSVRAVDLAYGWIMRNSVLVAAPTDFAARYAMHISGLGSVVTISNGVPLPTAMTVRVPRDLPVALYVGRLSAEKRLDVLLDAVQIVQRDIDFTLRIVGSGVDATRIMRRARELGLRNCEFLGAVSDDALTEIYRDADVFCMPSPVELECVAMLEAMAHGLPVVGPDEGAVLEVTKETQAALAYDAASGPKGAADALSILLADPTLRRAMGENARIAIAGRDLYSIARRWTAMYSEVIAKNMESVVPWVETRTYETSLGDPLVSHWTNYVIGRPTLLLLHGIAVDSLTCWSDVARLIAPNYNIVAFDLYGHGSNTSIDGTGDLLVKFSCRLHEAIQYYGLNGSTVIGHSLGGVVAQLLLKQAAAGVVKDAVLSSTAARFSSTRLDRVYFLWVAAAAGFVRILPVPLQGLVGVISARIQGLAKYPYFMASRMDWPQVLRSGVLLSRFDSRKWADKISVPMAQIVTEHDKIVSFDKQMELNHLLGDVETRVTNLDHDASITDPEGYTKTLLSLLAALERHRG